MQAPSGHRRASRTHMALRPMATHLRHVHLFLTDEQEELLRQMYEDGEIEQGEYVETATALNNLVKHALIKKKYREGDNLAPTMTARGRYYCKYYL